MEGFGAAVELCSQLKKLLLDGNLGACEPILTKLKVALTQFGFLSATAKKQELHLAREILELGAQWGIQSENISAFERFMAQLKTYYFDYASALEESPFMYELLGLNLLCLLSQNRIAEFHMELERLATNQLHDSIYIRYPVQLEQYLMEGAYNKVFLSKGNVPAPTYSYFVRILMDTTRDEIADCCEKAYKSLPKNSAVRLLLLDNVGQLESFAAEREWGQTVDDITFPETDQDAAKIEKAELINRTLGYARELEKIV